MTEHLGVTLFKVAFWIYLASTICYVAYLVNKRGGLGKLGMAFLLVGIAAHTASLFVITAAIGRLPFLNLWEYLLSFTWGAMVVYSVLELLSKSKAFGGFMVPLITAFAFLTYRLPSRISENVLPALRSGWKVPHITSAILAYSAFAMAFVLAIMYLVRQRAEGNNRSFWATRLPVPKVLDQNTYRTIAFGFFMQTILVISGAIWAQFAWGKYWSWDPKETWSFITWLIYAAYLHTRVTMGWRGRKSAIIAIAGFAAVIFTFFGVTYLLPGLHSYGTS